jgi:AraC-like DNA-binding protein
MCFDVDRTQSRAILDFAPRTSILRAREVRPWFSHLTRALQDILEETVRTPELVECRLGELFFLEAMAGKVLAPGREVDEVAFRAALIMRADLSAKWTANSLARRVGVSRSSFYDRFVRALGCPPSEYLLRARMQEAVVLLRDGVSVDQVATSVGYAWASSFTTAFRRYHGSAPSKIKKRT